MDPHVLGTLCREHLQDCAKLHDEVTACIENRLTWDATAKRDKDIDELYETGRQEGSGSV